jgi:hypothetical protein
MYTLQANDQSYEVVQGVGPAQAGLGYWVYFPRDTAVALAPDGAQSATVQVPAGRFVMAGNPSATRAVTIAGADVAYIFDPTSNGYIAATTLQPGQGAWVYSAAGVVVTLQ